MHSLRARHGESFLTSRFRFRFTPAFRWIVYRTGIIPHTIYVTLIPSVWMRWLKECCKFAFFRRHVSFLEYQESFVVVRPAGAGDGEILAITHLNPNLPTTTCHSTLLL